MVGQLGFKLAIELGKKIFGKGDARTNPNPESFPELLRKQLDKSSASPAAPVPAPLPQAPQGLQVMAPTVVADVPIAAAVNAYRRLDNVWPGRWVDTGLISSHQAP
jgi:hypothetical protein